MVHEFEIGRRELDFTSAGLGKDSTRVLLSDGVAIVNALKYFEFDANPAQTIICEQCGTPGCGTKSWVCLRALGEAVLLIPAFGEMLQGEWELTEYWPPHYIEKRGAVLFPRDTYQSLRAQIPGFREQSSIPPLQAREAAALLQWEAPQRVLGQFPGAISLRREDILAVSHGDLDAVVNALLQLLEASASSSALVRPGTASEVLTFYVDAPGTPEWSPLALGTSGEWLLNFAPDFCASPVQVRLLPNKALQLTVPAFAQLTWGTLWHPTAAFQAHRSAGPAAERPFRQAAGASLAELPHVATLHTVAEVAAAFVGFSLVAGLLGAGAADRVRFLSIRDVAEVGLTCVGAALFPSALHALELTPEANWRVASAAFSGLWMAGTIIGTRRFFRLGVVSLRGSWASSTAEGTRIPRFLAFGPIAAVVGNCLLWWNVASPNGAPGRYVFALLLYLAVGGLSFIAAVFHGREEPAA